MQITDKNGNIYASIGLLNHKITKSFEIKSQVFYADIHWDFLMKSTRKNNVTFVEISKYPAVSRDLALLVNKDITFRQIEDVAYQTERNLLKNIELFDVYEGSNLPEGKKSYAINLTLQDTQKTLTDKQMDKVMQSLINNFKNRLSAELR